MSTHAQLIRYNENSKKFECQTIHYDGYPDNILPLLENYKTDEVIADLFSYGNIVSLDCDVESTEFWERDKGEDEEECSVKESDFVENFTSPYTDYSYMFIDGEWVIIAEYGMLNDTFLDSKFAIK